MGIDKCGTSSAITPKGSNCAADTQIVTDLIMQTI